jgi:hypothetical protein
LVDRRGRVVEDATTEASNLVGRGELAREDLDSDLAFRIVVELGEEVDDRVKQVEDRD